MMRAPVVCLALAALVASGCRCGGASPTEATPDAGSVDTSAEQSRPADAPVETPRGPASPRHEGSALALSAAGNELYVAEEDRGLVRVVYLPIHSGTASTKVEVPGLPAQVLVVGDRVLVTVRSEGARAPVKPPAESKDSRIPSSSTGSGLLLVMKPDPIAGLVEVARVAIPQDAWGIAVTPDEKTALVTSAWTHQVSAVDLGTGKKKWSLDVAREPRAVVVRPDGVSAYVTHLVGAGVTRIDGLDAEPKAHAITLPPSPLRAPSGKLLDGSLAYSAVLSPDGSRLFVARHALGAMGEAAWFGAATVDVLLTADDSPLAPKREAGLPRNEADIARQMSGMINESSAQVARVSYTPFVQPRAMVYRKRTSTVLVASEGTNVVAELDARTVDPTMFQVSSHLIGEGKDHLIPVATSGGAPTGLALSADEEALWVYCRATDDLVQIGFRKLEGRRVHLGDDPLGEPDGKGRRIFYDATDSITSGGLACAGCHPEGRDDGHVWHEATFKTMRAPASTNFLGDGDQAPLAETKKVGHARQTPMLAGRVSAKGPYGWHAESAELNDRLIAGFGLHRWGALDPRYGSGELLGRAQYLAPFLRHGLVPPPRDVHPPTPEELRGKEIFESPRTRCSKCHAPETEYTDRIAYPFNPPFPATNDFEDEAVHEFKTPSLLFVGGSAPYLHDGRFSTLEALIEMNGDRMGHTSHLTRDEKAALIAFLRTL